MSLKPNQVGHHIDDFIRESLNKLRKENFHNDELRVLIPMSFEPHYKTYMISIHGNRIHHKFLKELYGVDVHFTSPINEVWVYSILATYPGGEKFCHRLPLFEYLEMGHIQHANS